ncbi:hypothetical protein OG735_18690 [Streptomyces sp. NBC_01210]|nr:hypothetical protein OG735_18690 [Streptomyces sp. NBC_01210]
MGLPRIVSVDDHVIEPAHLSGLDDETVHKLMRGNAIRMPDLDLDR